MKLPEVSIFTKREKKKLKSKLVLIDVLVPKSKGL